MSDIAKQLTDLTQSLLKLIGFDEAEVVVTKGEEETYSLNLVVSPEESGVLIGYHGETISGLQFILALMAHKKIGAWNRLVVNINDYRQKREQTLMEMAKDAAERAKTTGEEVVMPPMESFDRRIVHMALAEDKAVHTESVGEGRDRRLIIYPTSTPPSSS